MPKWAASSSPSVLFGGAPILCDGQTARESRKMVHHPVTWRWLRTRDVASRTELRATRNPSRRIDIWPTSRTGGHAEPSSTRVDEQKGWNSTSWPWTKPQPHEVDRERGRVQVYSKFRDRSIISKTRSHESPSRGESEESLRPGGEASAAAAVVPRSHAEATPAVLPSAATAGPPPRSTLPILPPRPRRLAGAGPRPPRTDGRPVPIHSGDGVGHQGPGEGGPAPEEDGVVVDHLGRPAVGRILLVGVVNGQASEGRDGPSPARSGGGRRRAQRRGRSCRRPNRRLPPPPAAAALPNPARGSRAELRRVRRLVPGGPPVRRHERLDDHARQSFLETVALSSSPSDPHLPLTVFDLVRTECLGSLYGMLALALHGLGIVEEEAGDEGDLPSSGTKTSGFSGPVSSDLDASSLVPRVASMVVSGSEDESDGKDYPRPSVLSGRRDGEGEKMNLAANRARDEPSHLCITLPCKMPLGQDVTVIYMDDLPSRCFVGILTPSELESTSDLPRGQMVRMSDGELCSRVFRGVVCFGAL
ncbi:hypothetical protein THAOC_08518 [Thalassiosira oceanica]|uniref:Uncharacterized protein n=1 Tax=Thalassiosira oceanica TaxID=159749 RepID=K0T9S0_THAOC|nr:hypothetical protein THAOC_08518 [Thalassiosira oceanica]|eukprot:EJK70146.1 hypothetical protein THAOC_08518 [Thalassiosira oceanica]